jgi:hypothetical protein
MMNCGGVKARWEKEIHLLKYYIHVEPIFLRSKRTSVSNVYFIHFITITSLYPLKSSERHLVVVERWCGVFTDGKEVLFQVDLSSPLAFSI